MAIFLSYYVAAMPLSCRLMNTMIPVSYYHCEQLWASVLKMENVWFLRPARTNVGGETNKLRGGTPVMQRIVRRSNKTSWSF